MFSMKDIEYTCQKCNHKWQDCKQVGFEKAGFELTGCPDCKSKNVEWEYKKPENNKQQKVCSTRRLARPDKKFVNDVLARIHKHHSTPFKKSTINLDW